MSKKKAILTDIFQICREQSHFYFNNDLVKDISTKHGFRNHNDVTKIDCASLLPDEIQSKQYCVAHLGRGNHRFIKALDVWFHDFENFDLDEVKARYYKPSLLNHTDTSESNIISTAFNQRILQEFLYESAGETPKIYLPRRTKIDASYKANNSRIDAHKLQMEIDATFEHQGRVTILEGKNTRAPDFAVYQLYHPFLHYVQFGIKPSDIDCCYLVQSKRNEQRIIRCYLYQFSSIDDISSIRLVRKSEYQLNPTPK